LIEKVEKRLTDEAGGDTKIPFEGEGAEKQEKKHYKKHLKSKDSSAEESKTQTNANPKKKKNDMSFSMKKIDFGSINSPEKQNSNAGKLISSFSCRADVVYKKILREFRRFYISDFNEVTGIKDLGKVSDREEVEEVLLEYISEVFSSEIK
jgi:hypothetical protein